MRTLIQGGWVVGFDGRSHHEAKLLAQVQESAERFWESVATWRARGQTIDDVAPMSYPVRPEETSR